MGAGSLPCALRYLCHRQKAKQLQSVKAAFKLYGMFDSAVRDWDRAYCHVIVK